MSYPFLDTNILIRYFDDTDGELQHAAAMVLDQIHDGTITVTAPEMVFTEAVYVLSSPRLYRLSRASVRDLLCPILLLPHVRVAGGRKLLRALDLWSERQIKWGDALIAAEMEALGERRIYSFDTHFDQLPGIERLDPRLEAA